MTTFPGFSPRRPTKILFYSDGWLKWQRKTSFPAGHVILAPARRDLETGDLDTSPHHHGRPCAPLRFPRSSLQSLADTCQATETGSHDGLPTYSLPHCGELRLRLSGESQPYPGDWLITNENTKAQSPLEGLSTSRPIVCSVGFIFRFSVREWYTFLTQRRYTSHRAGRTVMAERFAYQIVWDSTGHS